MVDNRCDVFLGKSPFFTQHVESLSTLQIDPDALAHLFLHGRFYMSFSFTRGDTPNLKLFGDFGDDFLRLRMVQLVFFLSNLDRLLLTFKR